MKLNFTRLIGIVLFLLGAFMVWFGVTKDMPPPMLTGVGFALIGLVFGQNKG